MGSNHPRAFKKKPALLIETGETAFLLIRVGAATKRKIVPGLQGMTLLILSDKPELQ